MSWCVCVCVAFAGRGRCVLVLAQGLRGSTRCLTFLLRVHIASEHDRLDASKIFVHLLKYQFLFLVAALSTQKQPW